MKKIKGFLGYFILISSIFLGCSSITLEQGFVGIDKFKNNYEKIWITENYKYDRKLIQLGVPTENSIVIWYNLNKNDLYKIKGRTLSSQFSKNDLEILINAGILKREINHPDYVNFEYFEEEDLKKTVNLLNLSSGNKILESWKNLKKIDIEISVDSEVVSHFSNNNSSKPYFDHYSFYDYGSGRIEIKNLNPDSSYKIALKLFNIDEEKILKAETSPNANSKKSFSFLAYSCMKPYVYEDDKNDNGLIFKETLHVLNMMNYRAGLRKKTPSEGPSFSLGLGDQVYVDAGATKKQPIALLWGKSSEIWRYGDNNPREYFDEIYKRYFSIPPFDSINLNLPSALMWDDHEIRDGWGSQGDENSKNFFFGQYKWKKHIDSAREAAFSYQFLRNPQLGKFNFNIDKKHNIEISKNENFRKILETTSPTEGEELYFNFEWGSTAFFIMDLRSKRNYNKKIIISDDQLGAIKEWLKKYEHQENKLLVLGSSVPFSHHLNNFGKLFNDISGFSLFRKATDLEDDVYDQWDSVPEQKQKLLNVLLDHFGKHENHNLLILSGDVHNSQVIYLILENEKGKRIFGHEVVSSGLAQEKFMTLGEDLVKTKDENKYKDFSFFVAGRINVPNFAEIFVDYKDSSKPPEVKLIFYPARDGKRLVNLGKSELPTIENKRYLNLSYNINNMEKFDINKFLPGANPWGRPHDRGKRWFWPKESETW